MLSQLRRAWFPGLLAGMTLVVYGVDQGQLAPLGAGIVVVAAALWAAPC